MRHLSAILFCAMMSAGILYAQTQPNDSTLSRTVVVENQYNPEVMDAYKVNVLPKVEEPAAAKKGIDYATSVRPLTGWKSSPMELVSGELKREKALPGYGRVAYGNRNNTDLKLSYLWDFTDRDQLGIMGSFYGFCGDVASFDEGEWDSNYNIGEAKSRFFRSDFLLDYKHQFEKMSLSSGGSFGSQVFNYMPYANADPAFTLRPAVNQRYSMGEGYIGIASVEGVFPLDFALQTGLRGFGVKHAMPFLPETSQKTVHSSGFIDATIDENRQVGVGFVMDNVMYDTDWKDYTLLQLNPYYTYQTEALQMRLGGYVDWQSANGSGIKAAPDVRMDYTFSDSYVVYVHAGGGAQLNDLYQLNDITPYWMSLQQLHSSYTYLDASVGLKGSPITGLKFNLYGGCKVVKDEVFALPGRADNYEETSDSAPSTPDSFCTLLNQNDVNVAYAGGGLEYGYRDLFDFSLKGEYNNWHPDGNPDVLTVLKPEFTLDAYVTGKLMNDLRIGAVFQYESRVKTDGYKKLEPVSNLSVFADYGLFNRVNVFVRLNNLLNKDYITSTGYRIQGFNAMAGISCRF